MDFLNDENQFELREEIIGYSLEEQDSDDQINEINHKQQQHDQIIRDNHLKASDSKKRLSHEMETTQPMIQQSASESTSSSNNKKRFVWPDALHKDFIAAVFDIGLKSVNTSELANMINSNVSNTNLQNIMISTDQIKSHLQKFRLYRDKKLNPRVSFYELSLLAYDDGFGCPNKIDGMNDNFMGRKDSFSYVDKGSTSPPTSESKLISHHSSQGLLTTTHNNPTIHPQTSQKESSPDIENQHSSFHLESLLRLGHEIQYMDSLIDIQTQYETTLKSLLSKQFKLQNLLHLKYQMLETKLQVLPQSNLMLQPSHYPSSYNMTYPPNQEVYPVETSSMMSKYYPPSYHESYRSNHIINSDENHRNNMNYDNTNPQSEINFEKSLPSYPSFKSNSYTIPRQSNATTYYETRPTADSSIIRYPSPNIGIRTEGSVYTDYSNRQSNVNVPSVQPPNGRITEFTSHPLHTTNLSNGIASSTRTEFNIMHDMRASMQVHRQLQTKKYEAQVSFQLNHPNDNPSDSTHLRPESLTNDALLPVYPSFELNMKHGVPLPYERLAGGEDRGHPSSSSSYLPIQLLKATDSTYNINTSQTTRSMNDMKYYVPPQPQPTQQSQQSQQQSSVEYLSSTQPSSSGETMESMEDWDDVFSFLKESE